MANYKLNQTGTQIQADLNLLDSNSATSGQILTANGTGGADWQTIKKLYLCTFGVTTYNEITIAIANNYIPYVIYESHYCWLVDTASISGYEFYCGTNVSAYCMSNNQWDFVDNTIDLITRIPLIVVTAERVVSTDPFAVQIYDNEKAYFTEYRYPCILFNFTDIGYQPIFFYKVNINADNNLVLSTHTLSDESVWRCVYDYTTSIVTKINN